MKDNNFFVEKSTNLYYDNKLTNNKLTNNNKLLTYICGIEDSQMKTTSSIPLRSTRGADTSGVNLNEWYKEGRRRIRQQEKIFYLGLSLTGASKTGRRSLNIDIITEPGTKPFKYIAKLAPYEGKHGVFQNKPLKTENWCGWEWCKQLYSEHTHNAYFGKLIQRTRNTKILSRTIAPMCLAGIVITDEIVAHIRLFDKIYQIPLRDISQQNTNQSKIYVAVANYYEDWSEGEYDQSELEELEKLC